jgi:hypothetical protein
LWLLAAPAAVFAIYSLSCWQLGAPLRPWLVLIASANLGYLPLVAAVLWSHAGTLTTLGMAWFAAEAVVVMAIALVELAIAASSRSDAR